MCLSSLCASTPTCGQTESPAGDTCPLSLHGFLHGGRSHLKNSIKKPQTSVRECSLLWLQHDSDMTEGEVKKCQHCHCGHVQHFYFFYLPLFIQIKSH